QAVVLSPTPVGRMRALGLALLGIALAAVGWTGGPAWRAFWWSLAAMVGVLFLVDLVLGPSCVCTLQTATQTIDVRSLRRLRRARWFMGWLHPYVELAQGPLNPAEILGRPGAAGPTVVAPDGSIPPSLVP